MEKKHGSGIIAVICFLLVLLAAFVYALTATDVTMTWVVPANVSHSISYGASCSASNFYFLENQCAVDSDIDGNGAQCAPYSSYAEGTTAVCQDGSSLQAIVVTNNGNIDLNMDGNFTADFAGADINLVLRVWLGNDTNCGTAGMGGWEQPCSVTSATSPVTTTTCRSYDQYNETASGRLITSLDVDDSNGLCFSGDFNKSVSRGNHPVIFRLTSRLN